MKRFLKIYLFSILMVFLAVGSAFTISLGTNITIWDRDTPTAHKVIVATSISKMGNGSAPIPEPATIVLFGTGLIGLAGLGRRSFLN